MATAWRCLGLWLVAVLCAAGEKAQEPRAAKEPDAKQDPPSMVCRNLTKGNVVASRLAIADTFETRRKGFLGRASIEPGEGMLLTPCYAIHMVGMKFALDVVFLDREMRVVAVYPDVPPGTLNRSSRRAHSTLELPPGTIAAKRIEVGDTLQVLTAEEAKATPEVKAAPEAKAQAK
ncbi:MAG TPA: DUF192 domain-containing protein [Planctomycetota bacterium]|nr:DUF192 domain-containing protein [Planctomycetota bacterium]HRR80309.1 DUF192 domain-containing protein [Planctomycetota bacterium]HRT96125.1 DUF192 domain-containing protein [Planctomycetota bacterium]